MLFDLVVIFLFIIFLVINAFRNPKMAFLHMIFYLVFTYVLYQLIYFIILLILNNNYYLESSISDLAIAFNLINGELNSYSSIIGEQLLVFDETYTDTLYLTKLTQSFIYTISFFFSSIISFIFSYLVALLIYLSLKRKGKNKIKNNKRKYIYSSFISLIFTFLTFSMTLSPYQIAANNLKIVNEVAYNIKFKDSLNEEINELNKIKTFYSLTNQKYETILNGYKSINNEVNNYNDEITPYKNEYYFYLDNYNDFIKKRDELINKGIDLNQLKELNNKLEILENDLSILKTKMDDNTTYFSSFNTEYYNNYYDIYGNLFYSEVYIEDAETFINKFYSLDKTINEYRDIYLNFIKKLPSLRFLNKIFSLNFGYGLFFNNNKLTTLTKEMNNFKTNYNDVYNYDTEVFKNYIDNLNEKSNVLISNLNDTYKEKENTYKNMEASFLNFKEKEDSYINDTKTQLNKIKSEVEEINSLLTSF